MTEINEEKQEEVGVRCGEQKENKTNKHNKHEMEQIPVWGLERDFHFA